jgi:cell division protein FtsB
MTKKSADLEAQLSELSQERTELDAKIEDLIADMADAPPEQRKTGDWAPNGALTRKYLELTNRQAVVEKDIIDLSRQIAAGDGPTLPN